MHVYCDESGNTGVDLLNDVQPVFALATTTISDADALRLLAPFLMNGRAEAKYSRLKGKPRGQALLLELFSDPVFNIASTKLYAIDKRFYLICHLVDKVIETVTHEAGGDLYDGDGAASLANVWFYTGEHILPGGHWHRVLNAFLQAIRVGNRGAYESFDQAVEAAFLAAPEQDRLFAAPLMMARGRLDDFIGIFGDLAAFDPAVDAFSALMQAWMAETTGRFDVTHDRSKPMRRNEAFLRTLMTPAATRLVGYGSRQAELPLRIGRLEFGDSQQIPQLQIADLFAGAAVDCLLAWSGRRESTPFHDRMRQTPLPTLMDGMWPRPEISRANEAMPGQVSIPDGTASFLREVGYR